MAGGEEGITIVETDTVRLSTVYLADADFTFATAAHQSPRSAKQQLIDRDSDEISGHVVHMRKGSRDADAANGWSPPFPTDRPGQIFLVLAPTFTDATDPGRATRERGPR